MKAILLTASALSLAAFFGCSHAMMRGSVAMKVNDEQAHICLGNKEVKIGDRLEFYRNVCIGGGGRSGDGRSCKKVSTGGGKVVQLLNEHYSVAKVDPGVQFDEGSTVEKR